MSYKKMENKTECPCGNYVSYGSTLKGVCAPAYPMDTCMTCIGQNTKPFDEVKFIAAIKKVKQLK